MPLDSPQADWLFRFTGGAIPVPPNLVLPDAPNPLQTQLAFLQAREWAEEQALKTVLLARAFAVIEHHKETMRTAFDMKVKTYDDPDAPDIELVDELGQSTGKTRKKSGVTTQSVRDAKGRQERAFDAKEATRMAEAVDTTSATKAMAILVGEKDKLDAQTTLRSHIDDKAKPPRIVQATEKLFTDKELMDELYTPLVRDLVVPETFVPDKFSATQKMIDGSNDYYIKECKSKGKPIPTGGAALAKGAIALGSSVANTVLAGMNPVKEGQQAMATSGKLSKAMAARATDITNGVAALLTGAVDVVDQLDDLRHTGDFSSSGLDKVVNSLALGLGKIVAGATGQMTLGMVITDSITGAGALAGLGADIAVWQKKGGEFPIDVLISRVGAAVAGGLSAASDQTSDTDADGNDNGKVSTRFAQASQATVQLFESAGAAAKGKLLTEIKMGNWSAVLDFIADTGVKVGQQLPSQIYLDQNFNEQTEYNKQKLATLALETTPGQIERGGSALTSLAGMAGGALVDKTGAALPKTEQARRMAEIEKAFAEKAEALAKAEESAAKGEIANIEAQMAKEKEAFRLSLRCLGSDQPSDADFKSIASLVEQLERDRKIWDGLTALFGGGLGAATGIVTAMTVAAEVVPALKAAGQLVKYCVNLKAAADRCEAWLTWREGRKDAVSAVSPYATSIDNFTKNQGQQFTHYSIQAAANAIQALLAAAEMSPLGPAFKTAGGAVAAAAAAEDLLYQFYKRQALRNAWKMTQQALDPKNYGNRKMALLVRQMNPTLAKYTMAYGALVDESPVAITACNRIGIDRETLARSTDMVGELKTYFEKLYPDDGVVVGVLDVTPGKTKVPAPALQTRAWALSMLVWTNEHHLATPNPPAIVAHLSLVQSLHAKQDRSEEQTEQLLASLDTLRLAFMSFTARTSTGGPIPGIQSAVSDYADLAEVAAMTVRMEADAAVDG